MSASDQCQGIAPADWRSHRLERLLVPMQLIRHVGDPDQEMFGKLADGYRVNAADLEAYLDHALRIERDLAALLRTMRIERVTAPLFRLVVDNTTRAQP
jgi:hypothetical protein